MDGSLRLRPRDMAKLGVMVMDGGVWQGQQVVDEAWVRAVPGPSAPAGPGGGIRIPLVDHGCSLSGPEGSLQAVLPTGGGASSSSLFPDLDLVVVTTGGNQENGKHMAIGEVLVQDCCRG